MNISTTALKYYPVETFFCFVHLSSGDSIELLQSYLLDNEWGKPANIQTCEIETNICAKEIDVVWLSLSEKKFYSVEEGIDLQILNDDSHTLLIGMMPYGLLCLWVYEGKKSTLVGWFKGVEVDVEMEDFLPECSQLNLDEYCTSRLENNLKIKEYIIQNGIQSKDFFTGYMRQFTYRYLPLFEKKEGDEKWRRYTEEEVSPELDYIEEMLFDGTFDKLRDGGLLKYHNAGKPKKLRVSMRRGKTEWTAYFWFDDEKIRSIFDRFYGIHRDTETDFIIHIDAENKKYELALFRQGLNEPRIIPEEAYQLIVFKNKFEDYRSDNYNQERGAWIW